MDNSGIEKKKGKKKKKRKKKKKSLTHERKYTNVLRLESGYIIAYEAITKIKIQSVHCETRVQIA